MKKTWKDAERKKLNMLCYRRREGKVTEELHLRSKRRMKDSGKFKEVTEQLKVAASQTEFDEI